MWIDIFLDYLKLERNYSKQTITSYGVDLNQFEQYFKSVDEKLDFIHVDADVVRLWVVSLMDEGYSAVSVNRKLSSLRAFYRFLLRKDLVRVDPMCKISGPKKKKPLPVFLREDDMDRLLDDMSFEDSFEGRRDKLILEVFYLTGIRLSELIGLKDADVDFSLMQIKVTGKRNKQRMIPFGGELKGLMLEYLKLRDETVAEPDAFFVLPNGRSLYPSKVYNIVRKNLSRVVTLKKKSPHVLRHTFATTMLNHDAELGVVKELLGHESLTTTEVYTHTTFEELKKVYEHAHPRA